MGRVYVIVLAWALGAPPVYGQVVINEVMFDPSFSEFTHEYVELLNVGGNPVDLEGWRLGDEDETDLLIAVGGGPVLGPGGYALVLDSGYL